MREPTEPGIRAALSESPFLQRVTRTLPMAPMPRDDFDTLLAEASTSMLCEECPGGAFVIRLTRGNRLAAVGIATRLSEVYYKIERSIV